jgi:hypothetical protein
VNERTQEVAKVLKGSSAGNLNGFEKGREAVERSEGKGSVMMERERR